MAQTVQRQTSTTFSCYPFFAIKMVYWTLIKQEESEKIETLQNLSYNLF